MVSFSGITLVEIVLGGVVFVIIGRIVARMHGDRNANRYEALRQSIDGSNFLTHAGPVTRRRGSYRMPVKVSGTSELIICWFTPGTKVLTVKSKKFTATETVRKLSDVAAIDIFFKRFNAQHPAALEEFCAVVDEQYSPTSNTASPSKSKWRRGSKNATLIDIPSEPTFEPYVAPNPVLFADASEQSNDSSDATEPDSNEVADAYRFGGALDVDDMDSHVPATDEAPNRQRVKIGRIPIN